MYEFVCLLITGSNIIEIYAQFRIIFILIRCVFLSLVRCYLQLFLGLYRVNREISTVIKGLFTNFVYRSVTALLAWERKRPGKNT